MDNDKLNQRLNDIEVPPELVTRIHQNWRIQKGRPGPNRQGVKWLAVAAGVCAAVVALRLVTPTPAVVEAALADIAADERHAVGISVPVETLVASAQVQPTIQQQAVRMTKYCKLNKARAVHVEINDHTQGEVHLFVREGQFDRHFWQAQQGAIGDRAWRLLQPREGVSVLVVSAPDVAASRLDALVNDLFYG